MNYVSSAIYITFLNNYFYDVMMKSKLNNLSEEEAREIIRKIDVSKTEPQLLVTLIERAISIGEEVVSDEETLVSCVDELASSLRASDIIEVATDVALKKARDMLEMPFASVDGSYFLGGYLHGMYFFPISAVCVQFKNFNDTNPVVMYSDETGIYTFDDVDSRSASFKASLRMLQLETEMIGKALNNDVRFIMVDGPLVDPPKKYAISEYRDLINLRTEMLLKALDNHIKVIGIVKRVTGNLLLKSLLTKSELRNFYPLFRRYTDRGFLDAIFTYLLLNESKVFYTKPMFPRSIPAYEDYKSKGLEVLTSFTQVSITTPPIRFEVIPPDENLVETVAALVSLTTLPSQYYAMPVMIAHEKCLIREGLAKTLFQEIISHFPNNISKLSKLLRFKYEIT